MKLVSWISDSLTGLNWVDVEISVVRVQFAQILRNVNQKHQVKE